MLVALKSKIKLVISPVIVPPRVVMSNISKFGVTIICLNPTLLSMISDEINRRLYNVASLRAIYVSGSILPDKIHEKAKRAFVNIPIYNIYGLSEAGPRVTAQTESCCKSNSVGKPIQNVCIQLIEETGCPVKQGQHGIIHVKTPSLFSGYVSGQRKLPPLFKDWLNTGDIGYVDDNGELHIVGRADDVIVIDSHKIYPHDVENIISKYEQIDECVVTQVEYKGNDTLVCLYTGEKECEKNIRGALKVKLPLYEVPKCFIHCNEIPRTLNGKVSMSDVKNVIIQIMEEQHDGS